MNALRYLWLIIALTGYPAAAATVSSTATQPVFIGNVVAGKTYLISATGITNLYYSWNGGQGLPFDADGRPTYAFPAPYSPFYPNGLDYDPSQHQSAYGIGGPAKPIGALMISQTAAPSGYGDYIKAGSMFSYTASTTGALYAMINDCPGCYLDNAGSLNVTLVEAEKASFSYDALGRLVTSVISGGSNSTIGTATCFDPAGNRTRHTVGSGVTTCGSSSAPPSGPPPVAVANYVSGACNNYVSYNVVSNDYDPNGNTPLTLVSVTGSATVDAQIVSSTTIQFIGYAPGTSSLSYVITNSVGSTASGTITYQTTGSQSSCYQ